MIFLKRLIFMACFSAQTFVSHCSRRACARLLFGRATGAMAPKGKNEAAAIVRVETHKLCEISVAEDSGWRDQDNERVQELTASIMEGNWGFTSLAGPSLVAENDRVLASAIDGGLILFNGKHIVLALLSVEGQYRAMSDEHKAAAHWLTESLEEVFPRRPALGGLSVS